MPWWSINLDHQVITFVGWGVHVYAIPVHHSKHDAGKLESNFAKGMTCMCMYVRVSLSPSVHMYVCVCG